MQLGIAIVNDFKSVEGDRALGLQVLCILFSWNNVSLLSQKWSLQWFFWLLSYALNGQSLPVAFGTETAKWICVGAIDVTQLSVAGM